MAQPIPAYIEADLERIVARDYPPDHRAHVKAVLARYGSQPWQREALRVHMACLKCAGGDVKQLEYYVRLACDDYRDVLSSAEYPAYLKARSEQEKEAAISGDWAQLQDWLTAK